MGRGRILTAVGGQTERPVDDFAATLFPSGILLVHANNGMGLGALAADTRPLPDVAHHDRLLTSRQRVVR